MTERWFIKNKKMNYKYMAQKYGISEVMSKLIVNRDIIDDEMIRSYIHPEYSMLHDGREMKDIVKGAEILKDKIKSGKKIRIVGDYDVDGVISVYILYSALKSFIYSFSSCRNFSSDIDENVSTISVVIFLYLL